MASEFIKKYSAEWAAHWNYNYRSFGGTDPKRFFRHEWCLYTAPDGSVTNYEDIVNEKFGAPKKAGFGPSTQKAIDAAQAAHRYQQDPVPQADGYSGTLPEDVTWIGEIDGKRYSGLGKPESGHLSHLPEGSH